MALKDWIQNKFGGTGKTLLDPSVYPRKALKKDIKKLEHQHKRIESDMEEHRSKYQKLLEQGAKAPEFKRKALARKARIEKKKYTIQKKKYRASSLKLGALVSIEGAREVMHMNEDVDLEIDELLQDEDRVLDMQGEMIDRMTEFGLDLEDFQEIEQELDLPIMQEDIDTQTTEEEEIMEKIAANKISAEQVDVDIDEADVEDEEIDAFSEIDEDDLEL